MRCMPAARKRRSGALPCRRFLVSQSSLTKANRPRGRGAKPRVRGSVAGSGEANKSHCILSAVWPQESRVAWTTHRFRLVTGIRIMRWTRGWKWEWSRGLSDDFAIARLISLGCPALGCLPFRRRVIVW